MGSATASDLQGGRKCSWASGKLAASRLMVAEPYYRGYCLGRAPLVCRRWRVEDAKDALDQPTVRAFDHIDDAALWVLNIGRAYPQTLAEQIGST